MNSTSESRWWVAIDQKTQGPFSAVELASLAQSQKIGPQTMACPLDGHAWLPISRIKELASLQPAPSVTPVVFAPQVNPYEATPAPNHMTRPAGNQTSVLIIAVAYLCLFWEPIYRGIQIVHSLASIGGITTEIPTEQLGLHLLITKVFILVVIGVLAVLAGLAWKSGYGRAVWLTCGFIALDGLLQWTTFWVVKCYNAVVSELVENPGPEFALNQLSGFERFLYIIDLVNVLLELMLLVWIIGWGRKLSWNDSRINPIT